MKSTLLVKNESSLLENCKVVSSKTVLLEDPKQKFMLEPFFNMKNDNESFELTVEQILQMKYDYDELLDVEAQEKNDTRHHVETFQEKCMSIAKEGLDLEKADLLRKTVFKAIRKRMLMILNLDTCIALLNNAYDCHFNGVNCHMSNLAINAKLNELKRLLNNPSVQEWLKTNPTDLSFEKSDYINTYTKVLRQLTDIRGESLEYLKDVIHNEEDIFEDEILANEVFEEEQYFEDVNDEDTYLD